MIERTKLQKLSVFSAALLCALYGTAAFAQSGRACVMFADANFDGRRLSMSPGDAVSFRSGDSWNDRVSSVRVARGCVLIAYSDNRMGGRVIEIDRNVRNLRNMGWNDRISSAECDCANY